MSQVGTKASWKLRDLLNEPESGFRDALAELSLAEGVRVPMFPAEHLRTQNVAAEIVEKSTAAKYPAVHIYCEKVNNTLREKFRIFSGTARMVAEVRVSHDRLDGIEKKSQVMADAVTGVLDGSRGDWGQGMFYTGGYEVQYGPVKHGGRNFLQITRVTFDVDISTN